MKETSSIVLYRYSDNAVEYTFPYDISGETAYSQIRDKDDNVIAVFTCEIASTVLTMKLAKEDLANVTPGNYKGDVKLKNTVSGWEDISFELAVTIQNAKTRLP
jgi:hypothetical protein